MTKEEFEKEAEEIANKKLCSERICYNHCNFNSPKHHRCGEWHRCYESAKEGENLREKQIQIDAEQIRALQKQNGELTDELKTLRESIKDYGAGCYENGLRNGKRKLEEQLTKAKKIIKALLRLWNDVMTEETVKVLVAEAEQFLSEVEK